MGPAAADELPVPEHRIEPPDRGPELVRRLAFKLPGGLTAGTRKI